MKRLLLLLPLLLIAAGDGEIPGWKVVAGRWGYAKKIISSENPGVEAVIEAQQGEVRDFRLEAKVRFSGECPGRVPTMHCLAVFFDVTKSTRLQVVFTTSEICVGQLGGPKQGRIARVPTSVRKGQWLPLSVTQKKGILLVKMGKTTLRATLGGESVPGWLRLAVNGYVMQIRRLELKPL